MFEGRGCERVLEGIITSGEWSWRRGGRENNRSNKRKKEQGGIPNKASTFGLHPQRFFAHELPQDNQSPDEMKVLSLCW